MASGEEEKVINGSDNDGDASGEDIFPSDGDGSSLCSPTPSDAEIEELENSLREKLALKKKLEKKERLRQLSKELKEVEKHSQKGKVSKSKGKTGKKNKNQITVASLRSMEDVQEEVEKLMNKHLKNGMAKLVRSQKAVIRNQVAAVIIVVEVRKVTKKEVRKADITEDQG